MHTSSSAGVITYTILSSNDKTKEVNFCSYDLHVILVLTLSFVLIFVMF